MNKSNKANDLLARALKELRSSGWSCDELKQNIDDFINKPKKFDAFDALSKVSGVRRDKIDQIWIDVKENQKMLKGCELPHIFEPADDRKLPRNYECVKCGGTLSTPEARWYNDGMRDAYKVAIKDPVVRAACSCNGCGRMLIGHEKMICHDCERKFNVRNNRSKGNTSTKGKSSKTQARKQERQG